MKAGRSLSDIAAQVVLESTAKKDYVALTSALTAVTVPGADTRSGIALQFAVNGQNQVYATTDLCLNQIAQHTGIPANYVNRMREEAPELLAQNINHWFKNVADPKPRMLRTLNNGHATARAFLGNTYRPLDNYDLFATIVPHLEAAGCVIRSAEITDTRLYIQASTPRISRPIEQTVNLGGHQTRLRVVEAGVIIGNSEVGCGSIFVDPMLYDNWCTNGAIMERTLKRRHVGGRNLLGDGDEASELLFSEKTRLQDDKTFWMKVNDVVQNTLQGDIFNTFVDKLVAAQSEALKGKSTDVIEIAADRLRLNQAEKENVLLHYMQGGDSSKFGLIQAVTRSAEDAPSYDRAIELERVGGGILEMPARDFSVN
jgi:hypothetical protein